jgi:hypothetical protein
MEHMRHGEGTEYRQGGTRKRYEGTWNKNFRDGYGAQYWFNGNVRYEGEYVNDKRDGQGSEYQLNGTLIYRGAWKNDKRHGYGTAYTPNDTVIFEGKWRNDEPIRKRKRLYECTICDKAFFDEYEADECCRCTECGACYDECHCSKSGDSSSDVSH